MKTQRVFCLAAFAAAAALSGAGASLAAPSASYARGIDVSEYEGTINWPRVAANGVSFAIARVSDGVQHPDAYFKRNWSGMKSAGIVRGVYQFFRPAEDPIAQADLLLSKTTFEPGDLPPFLDLEVTGGQSASTITTKVAAWCNHVKAKTGLTPLVYTSVGFWDGHGLRKVPTGVGLWVANWGVSSPRLPSSWSDWTFWQYNDHTSVPGVTTADANVFHGTVAQLKAFAASRGTVRGAGGSGGGGAPSGGTSHPVLKEGASGPDVVTLQQDLVKAGFSPGPIDGSFGPKTLAAVKAFQSSKGLVADGIVGPLTWATLP